MQERREARMMDELKTTYQQTETDKPTEIQTAGVFLLTTCVQGSLIASHQTREGAMAATVDWMEGEAETRPSGSLAVQYEMPRRQVGGQDGKMKLVWPPIFG